MIPIPFNKPFFSGKELEYIQQAHSNGHLSGNGPFTQKCQVWLEKNTGSRKALLTHSCTAALEMSAMLSDLSPGDEVIMPSYTFVSTANAFVLRGAIPVFVDIRPDTFNIDEAKIEAAVTPRTKAIVAVHYAGVSCEMDAILSIARKHNLLVIEDAAQGIGSKYKGRSLGSLGHFGAMSFHETKNIISGEGGALLVNEDRFLERAEVLREKGTNRNKFLKGQVDKYTWVDIGSSYLPSDLIGAFLLSQLEAFDSIMEKRMLLWKTYHRRFKDLEARGLLKRPAPVVEFQHNAHMYYLLLPTLEKRDKFISAMGARGIQAVFHYVPLHDSPAGRRFGRSHGSMENTTHVSHRVVRLPFWIGMESYQDEIIDQMLTELERL